VPNTIDHSPSIEIRPCVGVVQLAEEAIVGPAAEGIDRAAELALAKVADQNVAAELSEILRRARQEIAVHFGAEGEAFRDRPAGGIVDDECRR
jgi:hypothetical protein